MIADSKTNLEVVAIALFNEDNHMAARERNWNNFDEDSHTKQHWRRLARAALNAME